MNSSESRVRRKDGVRSSKCASQMHVSRPDPTKLRCPKCGADAVYADPDRTGGMEVVACFMCGYRHYIGFSGRDPEPEKPGAKPKFSAGRKGIAGRHRKTQSLCVRCREQGIETLIEGNAARRYCDICAEKMRAQSSAEARRRKRKEGLRGLCLNR